MHQKETQSTSCYMQMFPKPQDHYCSLNIGYYYNANCIGPEIKLQLWPEKHLDRWNESISGPSTVGMYLVILNIV